MSGDATIGDLIAERYRLERVLGRGGMATVFVATDEKLNRNVAIKLLHTDLARQPNFRTRFRQEAQAAARLNHPNVVRVFDAGESADPTDPNRFSPFLVMELVDGHTLADLLHSGPIAHTEAVRIARELLSALEFAHASGIVHRDIKPGNIMVTPTGGVKVLDFGIARSVESLTESISQTTSILGTAAYFSPEQARGEEVDAQSDLYSAGVVLFEMLTGSVPFREESPVRVAYQHVSEPAPAPSSRNSTVSPALDSVVLRALAKNRAERFGSATEFSAALEAAERGQAVSLAATEMEAVTTQFGVNELSVNELSASELALRQLAEGGTEVYTDVKRPPVMWFWAGGALIFALVLAVLFWAVNLAPASEIQSTDRVIPTVAGMSVADATSALKKVDLDVVVVDTNDANVPVGSVVRSDPASGETVPQGTKVTLFVSKGQAAVAVPDVRNLPLDQAKAALQAAGFVVGAENKVNSPNIPAGVVVSTDPAAGTEIAPGTTINLNVSSGKVTVPSVVGKSLSEASALLQSDDLRLTVNPVGDTGCVQQAGNPVTQQSIGPGDVPQGSSVTLVFCAAPAG